jgi:hypothetical protein
MARKKLKYLDRLAYSNYNNANSKNLLAEREVYSHDAKE